MVTIVFIEKLTTCVSILHSMRCSLKKKRMALDPSIFAMSFNPLVGRDECLDKVNPKIKCLIFRYLRWLYLTSSLNRRRVSIQGWGVGEFLPTPDSSKIFQTPTPDS